MWVGGLDCLRYYVVFNSISVVSVREDGGRDSRRKCVLNDNGEREKFDFEN